METKLGQLIEGTQERDAIHIAIAPVRAWQTLYPGQHIGFVDGSNENVAPVPVSVGIVDPFLTTRVMKGDWFWMCLYPNSITSLRHDWTHPEFQPRTVTNEFAQHRLHELAHELRINYEDLLEQLAEGDVRFDDTSGPEEARQYEKELITLYGAITGKTLSGLSFSCSC